MVYPDFFISLSHLLLSLSSFSFLAGSDNETSKNERKTFFQNWISRRGKKGKYLAILGIIFSSDIDEMRNTYKIIIIFFIY